MTQPILDNHQFKDHEIKYCELCQTFYIVCEHCNNSSCSSMGCDKCTELFKEFHKLKHSPLEYLTDKENETIIKYKFIKKYLPRFLAEEKEFDIKSLQQSDETSQLIDDIFRAS